MFTKNKTSKNIVVLFDGTWSNPNSKTNVNTLYKELLEREYEQHVAYIDGIGIGEMALSFILEGAMAISLDNKIKEGYKYIINHYNDNPGDDIWLFGFSRGAYTARCVAGMIRNCGILKLQQDEQDISSDQIDRRVDLAYEIYRSRDLAYRPGGSGSDDFKKAFSYPDSKKPIIKFLGLWDTVGAHGLPGYIIGEGFRYLEFYDQVVPSVVNCACQALAIHERTTFFEPCRILPDSSRKVTVKETWFPGVHGEIGGGNKGNERISNATLLWMIENIVQVGGLLMRDDIETYRTRFSPDSGPDSRPSWNVKNFIFDNAVIPPIPVPEFIFKNRVIPLELDSSQKFLRKDLLYRDGDWLLPFGPRSNLITQYSSNTYEELRKAIEKKGVKLFNNVKYDKDGDDEGTRL